MTTTENKEKGILPGKLPNEHKYRNIDNGVDLLMNAYPLDLKQMVKEVFQYKLTFTAYRIRKDNNGGKTTKAYDLSKGKGNDEAKVTNQQLHWDLFQQLIATNPDFFGRDPNCFVYDCSQLLFSTIPLPLDLHGSDSESATREFVLELDDELLNERCRAFVRSIDSIKAVIELTEHIDVTMSNVQSMLARGERSAVHFLELLTSQQMFKNKEHFLSGDCMYAQDLKVNLQGDARILLEGMQKNVRFVGDDLKGTQPIMQLDSKKSAFFPDKLLHEFLGGFLNCRDARDLERQLRKEQEKAKAEKQIRGLAVKTTFLPKTQRIFTIIGLSEKSADRTYFKYNDRDISVYEYFDMVYHHKLYHPGLPCAVQRTARGENYYPLELIRILDGQRVPLEKQTSTLTQAMIRQCQILPSQLPKEIEKQRDLASLRNANPFLRSHGVRIDDNGLLRVRGERLHPPAIVYSDGDRVEPRADGSLDWKMTPHRRFLSPATLPNKFVITIVQHSVPENNCSDFCNQLIRMASSRGIVKAEYGSRGIMMDSNFVQTDREYVEDKFRKWQNEGVQLVLLFADGKDNGHVGDIHHTFKLMETRFGILTLHISPKTVSKWRNGRGGFMVIDNILMKLNEKLGGVNWSLNTSMAFEKNNGISHDIVANEWLGERRMFVGITMSHPPPQSRFERRVGVPPANPTVVGISYTIGQKAQLLKMHGFYWLQRARLVTVQRPEDVRPLIDAVKKAMNDYLAENECYPRHLIVYRGGVSDGEFELVSNWEGKAFGQAVRELHIEKPDKMKKAPRVTIVVCQRHSNYRLIPSRVDPRASAPQQNVQPGTVVDRGVMSPVLTEFLLVAHKALQGTAQPVRCTVVYESKEDRIPLEELRYVTHHLCYGNGICTLPTALPAPLFSAGELAKRGRNNLRTDGDSLCIDIEQVQGEHGSTSQQSSAQQVQEAEVVKLKTLTKKLQPTIPTKFWA